MKKLTKKQQLKVLRHAKAFIKESTRECILEFLCLSIDDSAIKLFDTNNEAIPSFNYSNVCRICEENNIVVPEKEHGVWWHVRSPEFNSEEDRVNKMNGIRLKVLSVLIKELT